MTLSVSGYTVGGNRPLNHARILWNMVTGTVTGDGTDAALAANDITSQRWKPGSGGQRWTMTPAASVPIDMMVIAAHNLAGKIIRPQIGGANRTNLILHSENITPIVTPWTVVGAAMSGNVAVSPFGTATAERITETAVSGSHHVFQNVGSLTANTTHTFSIYVKADGRNRGDVRLIAGSDSIRAEFNLATGTVQSGAAGVGVVSGVGIEALPDGWFRVRVTGIPNTTATAYICQINMRNGGGSDSYTGDGTSALLLWGAQLEVGATATSYVPTANSAVTSDWYDFCPWITVDDNSTIAILSNNAGAPWDTGKFSLLVSDAIGVQIGIIRAGVALQMERPFYGGHGPLNWSRATEAEPSVSEGGQWLSQIVRRISQEATYSWQHLSQDWYRTNFEPFAKTLPQRPFGIVGNPSRLADADVGWCFTKSDVRPVLMGVRDLVQVDLPVTGYAG